MIVQGDALRLPLPDASVDLVVTSPPYFALRAYSAGAGEVGSEETPQAYLEALWAATREMVRVLKPTGSLFVNLGDKYAGKSLLGLPWRYAIGCIDQLDLILRRDQIWHKPNHAPESVKDRTANAHEYWFHLVKQPRYYSAIDEIREPHAPDSLRLSKHSGSRGSAAWNTIRPHEGRPEQATHPLGKLPGSVWSISSERLRLPDHLGVQHYAAFPSEWPWRLIRAWSPPGGIVLDPFSGSGTTAMVARTLGRVGVGVDLSADYCRLARWRVFHSGHHAKAEARTNAERQLAL